MKQKLEALVPALISIGAGLYLATSSTVASDSFLDVIAHGSRRSVI
jgi:hypothetical protein